MIPEDFLGLRLQSSCCRYHEELSSWGHAANRQKRRCYDVDSAALENTVLLALLTRGTALLSPTVK